MKKYLLFLPWICLASPSSAIEIDIDQCHDIATPTKRLECYDRETGYTANASGNETTENASVEGMQWRYSSETSALDDRKDVWLSIMSDNSEGNAIGQPTRATLWVRCMENRTNVLVGFNRFTSDSQNVKFRLDDGPVQNQWMEPMRGGEGIGIWSGARAIPFIRKMFGRDRLVLAYDTYSGPVEFIFDISGLRSRIGPLAEACEWAP